MRKMLILGVALAFLAFAACGDDDSAGNNTTENCTDADGDTYGVGTDCTGPDCNDNDANCWLVGDACCTPECTDADADGYGVGAGCLGADCDDADAACWEGACCNATDCTDLDQDGYGTGADCLGADCDDSNPQCWVGACCPAANCVDIDQDGYGNGTDCLGPDCNDADASCHTPGGTPECCPEPGNGNAGEACSDASQCTAIIGGTPECMTDIMSFVQFPGGYCTGNGCTEGAPCDGDGGVCLNVYIGNYCIKPCTDSSECRTSETYDCVAMPGGQPGDPTYCLPPMGM